MSSSHLIKRSYKFRLKPNRVQEELLNKHFGCNRFVFNHFLNERISQYQNEGISLNYFNQARSLTDLKKQEETIWLKEINSQSLQHSLKDLEKAYKNFFKRGFGFPRFKSRKNKKESFRIPQHIRIEEDRIFFPKCREGIKLIAHRAIKGTIGECTFSKTCTGKYFVSIQTEQDYFAKYQSTTGRACGIDLGSKDLIATSDGQKIKNPKFFKKHQKALATAQQWLSKKKPGSQSFENQKRKTNRIHEKLTNSRKDFLHKTSLDLIRKYDQIFVEDLDIPKMNQDPKHSKSNADTGWGLLIQFLKYKAEWNNKDVIKIDRFFPSSKTCSKCGWIYESLGINEREWTCTECKSQHDRDLNAAINILNFGLGSQTKQFPSAGTAEYTGCNKTTGGVATCSETNPEAYHFNGG